MKYRVDTETGCWIWTGPQTKAGYPGGYAHRKAWEKVNGPRPAGYDIHHLCRNTLCVNPDHLSAVDQRAHDLEHFLIEKGRTFSHVLQVRAERADGATLREIASRHGLSYSTVRRWCGNGLEPAWTEFVGPQVVPPQRVCLREDCDNLVMDQFKPGTTKLFCSATCRGTHNGRRYRAAARAA